MGEYMPNNEYCIVDGYAPHVNMSNASARTALRSKGYRLSDYANYNSVVMLALVKYADLNFQYCLGMGWNSGNRAQISSGDEILGDDGYNGATREANASIKVMGIADLYGNVFKHCDAIFVYGGYVYVNDDVDSITEWPTMDTWEAMGYKKSTLPLVSRGIDSVICEVVNNSQFPWMTFPTKWGGDNTNPIGDNCWTNNDNTMRCVVLGGSAWNGATDGPFCWSSEVELLHTSLAFGCLASAFPV